jgi:hypothetical protein
VDAVAVADAAAVACEVAVGGCAAAAVAHSVAAAERDPRWAARLPCRGPQWADLAVVPMRVAARGRLRDPEE